MEDAAGGERAVSIELRGVAKVFGASGVLRDVNLRVETGELAALVGPSGAGKTTLLRVIAGLEPADEGQVLLLGRDAGALGARERGVGFVFQHYALFRHLTAFENVAFGLRVKPRRERPPEREIRARVESLLELVHLAGFEGRMPSQLSGGQRQRVALARALAVEPKVLLLDEPFGSLDSKVRQDLRRWLRRLHEEIDVTSVLVTHDQEEALEVADRVVVMNAGRVEQIGTPDEVYHSPATPFVCRFLGRVNFFPGRVHQGRLTFEGMELHAPEHAGAQDRPAAVYARPHEIEISDKPGDGFAAAGVLSRVNGAGPVVRLELRRAGDEKSLVVECSSDRRLEVPIAIGSPVFIRLRRPRIFIDDAN
jgi:sulfate transport system ATP-binding protein